VSPEAPLTRTERMLRACRGEPVDRPPVWLMRQAGRYLPEYRAVREGIAFLDMCRDVERAVEVSLQPLRLVGTEAVVFFSDIFVPVTGLGIGVEFVPGPRIAEPIRSGRDVARLAEPDPREAVPYVFEILSRLRAALEPQAVPLIGFAGAPFTLATYLAEGEGDPTRRFPRLRAWMAREPEGVRALLDHLAAMTVAYLNAQIAAGAQVVQLFDTWAGSLDVDTYRRFVLPANRAIVEGVDRTAAPFILYTNEAVHLLDEMMETGTDVISVGSQVKLSEAARRAGSRASVQGNLDPSALACSRQEIFRRVRALVEEARPARGHILNLGHGCLPDSPVDGVRAFTDAARALGSEP
jgi:uroporphyrinogen decarboxylase